MTAESVQDVAGKPIEVGDTVVTVNGQTTGRVCNINIEDDDTAFVAIRPVYHSYGKGVWYAADQVFWVARPNAANKDKKPSAKAAVKPKPTATGKIAGKTVAAAKTPAKPSAARPASATRSSPAKKK